MAVPRPNEPGRAFWGQPPIIYDVNQRGASVAISSLAATAMAVAALKS